VLFSRNQVHNVFKVRSDFFYYIFFINNKQTLKDISYSINEDRDIYTLICKLIILFWSTDTRNFFISN